MDISSAPPNSPPHLPRGKRLKFPAYGARFEIFPTFLSTATFYETHLDSSEAPSFEKRDWPDNILTAAMWA